MELKEKSYTDNIYKHIPYSFAEKKLINLPVVSRLFSVRQNSIAYKTFPALTTNRFIHSLGVMHLSSLILKSTFINTDPEKLAKLINCTKDIVFEVVNNSIEDLTNIFEKWGISGKEKEWLDNTRFDKTFIRKWNSVMWVQDHSLKNFIPDITPLFNSSSKLEISQIVSVLNTYGILLQTIRFMGLLHDIGHFPFSHILEDVIHYYLLNYMENRETKERLIAFEDYINFLDIDIREMSKDDLKKISLHDLQGKKLIEKVFLEKSDVFATVFDLRSKSRKENLLDWKILERISIFVSLFLSKELLSISLMENTENIIDLSRIKLCLGWLHEVIHGTFGADRMDYVLRDTQAFGSTENINWRRIVQNYVLVKEKDSGSYEIVPKSKIIRDLDLLWYARYNVYKYLVDHHNVIKHNYLIKEMINLVLNAEIEAGLFNRRKQNIFDFSSLRQLLDVFPTLTGKSVLTYLFSPLIQWDDYGVINILRRTFTLLKHGINQDSPEDLKKFYNFIKKEGEYFSSLYEEFAWNKDIFVPLWKRESDWISFIEEVFIKNNKLIEFIEKICNEFSKSMKSLRQVDTILKNNNICNLISLMDIVKLYYWASVCLEIPEGKGIFCAQFEEIDEYIIDLMSIIFLYNYLDNKNLTEMEAEIEKENIDFKQFINDLLEIYGEQKNQSGLSEEEIITIKKKIVGKLRIIIAKMLWLYLQVEISKGNLHKFLKKYSKKNKKNCNNSFFIGYSSLTDKIKPLDNTYIYSEKDGEKRPIFSISIFGDVSKSQEFIFPSFFIYIDKSKKCDKMIKNHIGTYLKNVIIENLKSAFEKRVKWELENLEDLMEDNKIKS